MSVNGNRPLIAHVFYVWEDRNTEARLEASFNGLDLALEWAAIQADEWPGYTFTAIEEPDGVGVYGSEYLLP